MLFSMVFVGCADPTVNDIVNQMKSDLPQDLGDGDKITDVGIVDNYLQIEMTTDESECLLNDPVASSIYSMVLDGLKDYFLNDNDMKMIYEICAKEGKGFRVLMKGAQSGETIPFLELTPDELKEKYPPK